MRHFVALLTVFGFSVLLLPAQERRLLIEVPVGTRWRIRVSVVTTLTQNELFRSFKVTSDERFVVEAYVSDRIIRGKRVEYQARIVFKDVEVKQDVVWRQAGKEVWRKRWHYRKGEKVPKDMRWFDEELEGEGKICIWRNGEFIGETHRILWPYLRRVPCLPKDGAAPGDKWLWRFDLSSVLARFVLKSEVNVKKAEKGLLLEQTYKGLEIGKAGKAGSIAVKIRLVKAGLKGRWRVSRDMFLPSGGFEAEIVVDGSRQGGFVPVEPVRTELRTRLKVDVERINR